MEIVAVAIAIVLTKIVNLLKDILLTSRFGVGNISDAFILSYSLIMVIFVSLAGSFNTCYIPVYNTVLADKEDTRKINGNILALMIIISIVFFAVLTFFKTPLLKIYAGGLSEEAFNYLVLFTRIMLPSVLVIGVYYVIIGFLQVKGYRILVSIHPAIVYLSLILAIFLFDFNFIALPLSVLVGNLVVFSIVIYIGIKNGFKAKISSTWKNVYYTDFVKMLIPAFAATLLADLNSMIDKALASQLPSGTVTALDYSYRLSNSIFSIFVSSTSIVLFPIVAKLVANKEYDELHNTLCKHIKTICWILMPIIILSVFYAKDIVTVLFFHGKFDTESVGITSNAFMIYVLSAFPIGIRIIIEKVYFSFKKNKLSTLFSGIGVMSNIILNIILINIWGYIGLAIATVISSMITTVLYITYFKHIIAIPILKIIGNSILPVILSTIPMIMVMLLMNSITIKTESLTVSSILHAGLGGICSILTYLSFYRFVLKEEIKL